MVDKIPEISPENVRVSTFRLESIDSLPYLTFRLELCGVIYTRSLTVSRDWNMVKQLL